MENMINEMKGSPVADIVEITEVEDNPQAVENIAEGSSADSSPKGINGESSSLKGTKRIKKAVKCPYCFKYITELEKHENVISTKKGAKTVTEHRCPKCQGVLPESYGEYPVKMLSVIGTTSSGKTVYLSNLLKFSNDNMRNPLMNYSYSVRPYNSVFGGDQNSSLLEKVADVCKLELKENQWVEDREEHEKKRREGVMVTEDIRKGDYIVINYPRATDPDDEIKPLIIELSYEFADDMEFSVCRHLVLYDIAGESFKSPDDVRTCKYLFHSDGFLCLISPDDIKGIWRGDLEFRTVTTTEKTEDGESVKYHSVYEDMGTEFLETRTNMLDVLSILKTVFEEKSKSGKDAATLRKLPLAIALTKSDMYYGATLKGITEEMDKTFGEDSNLFKRVQYEENNNNYKKSEEKGLSAEIKALFPYNSNLDGFKNFRQCTKWFNICRMFAFSSFPAIQKIEFKGREKVRVLTKDGADGTVREVFDLKEIFEVKDITLEDRDFLPIRVEEPIGWLFYKWGWIGADKEKKTTDFLATKLLKMRLVRDEGKEISGWKKLSLYWKILIGKEKSAGANMER